MRVELPSGGWVEVAEKWKGILPGQVQGAVLIRSVDGEVHIPGDIGERQAAAFLRYQITDWSFAQPPPEGESIPIPKVGGEMRADVVRETLDGDDWDVLREAIRPLLLKLNGSGRGNSATRNELPAS